MRICHVITRLILGGAQENTLLTCEGLHRRGHEVVLVTGPALGPEGELMQRAQAGGYEVRVLDSLRREIHPLRDWRVYQELGELFTEIRPEVMHSHSSKAGILARRAARRVGGMKIVHTVHGLAFHRYERWWRNRMYIALERREAKYTDAIISVAEAMTIQALSAGVGRPEQYTTIYSGMEVQPYLSRPALADELRAAMRLPEDAVLVTQVSRLAELKGHAYLLAAASLMANPRIHFCLVGDGHLRRAIEAEIGRRGLTSRFHLTGLLPPEQIPAVMHASDIVVHCSLREGLARAIPQALLSARPVVSFDVDGAGEVVTHDTGFLLPPKDVAALRMAIETLSDSPALRQKMGANGRAFCRDRFDHEVMVRQIEAVYEKLL
jgi:glycosyltransferase involved in cell wall biosynthesis